MKLDQSMVGRKVREKGWVSDEYLLVEWLKGNYFSGVDEKGDPFADKINDFLNYEWEFYEEPPKPKLPSERITYEVRLNNPRERITYEVRLNNPLWTPNDFERVLLKHLDEQAIKS